MKTTKPKKKTSPPRTKKTKGKRRDRQPDRPAAADTVTTIAGMLALQLLTRGRVVLIGLGGIGLIVARYLTLFLASLKPHEFRLLLCDGDAFEQRNTYRMDVPDFDNKAAATAAQLGELFGRPGLHIRWLPEFITQENASRLIQEGDAVLLAVDNHATRHLVNRRCAELQNVVLISGGNDGVDDGQRGTYGNVQIYQRRRGQELHPALDHFHPEIAQPADKRPDEQSCLELAATSVPQLLFTNLAVASAMCCALWRLLLPPTQPIYDEVCLDIFEAVNQPHWLGHLDKKED